MLLHLSRGRETPGLHILDPGRKRSDENRLAVSESLSQQHPFYDSFSAGRASVPAGTNLQIAAAKEGDKQSVPVEQEAIILILKTEGRAKYNR